METATVTEQASQEQTPQQPAKIATPAPLAHHQQVEFRPADPIAMVQYAIDRGMEPSVLKEMMDLAERQQENVARQQFSLAMANFKAEAPRLIKNKRVDYQSRKADGGRVAYNHATLDYILKEVCPVMSRHGLSHQWFIEQSNGAISVTCRLAHVLGHSETVTLTGMPDQSGSKNSIQAIGSTTKYLQRYTFMSITGLAEADDPDEDDAVSTGDSADSNQAQPAQRTQRAESQRGQSQLRPYPQERFDAKLPQFKDAVKNGKTPQEIISILESTASLSNEQRKTILALKKGDQA